MELYTQRFTTTGDVRAVVRTATEAVCGVFVVWACSVAMVTDGWLKLRITASDTAAARMIIAE